MLRFHGGSGSGTTSALLRFHGISGSGMSAQSQYQGTDQHASAHRAHADQQVTDEGTARGGSQRFVDQPQRVLRYDQLLPCFGQRRSGGAQPPSGCCSECAFKISNSAFRFSLDALKPSNACSLICKLSDQLVDEQTLLGQLRQQLPRLRAEQAPGCVELRPGRRRLTTTAIRRSQPRPAAREAAEWRRRNAGTPISPALWACYLWLPCQRHDPGRDQFSGGHTLDPLTSIFDLRRTNKMHHPGLNQTSVDQFVYLIFSQ